MKFLFCLVFFVAACFSFAQTGPMSSAKQVPFVKFSNDYAKFMTANYQEMAMWETETGKLLWHKTWAELGVGNGVDITFNLLVAPNLKYLYVRANPSNFFVNLETMVVTPTKAQIDYLSSYGIGIYQDINVKKKAWTTDFFSDWQECKGFSTGHLSDDGKKMLQYMNDKKCKSFDLATRKTETLKGSAWNQTTVNKYAAGLYTADQDYVPQCKIRVTGKDGKQAASFEPKYGGFGRDQFFIHAFSAANPYIYTHEQKLYRANGAGTYDYYHDYIICYSVPDGKIVKEIELSNSPELAAQETKKIQEEENKRNQAESERRNKLLANMKPGYKEFDAKFSRISGKFVLDYNTIQGFELPVDEFVTNAVIPNGGKVFGIAKICSCTDFNSYLIMVRTKTESTDRSNFIVVTYQIDGTYFNSRNIGTTQKDPSGLLRLDFTIEDRGCGAWITSKMTHPNGYTEDKSTQVVGCKVN